MRLPFINSYPPKSQRAVAEFKGVNENLVISDKEFSAMSNLSCHNYPAISTRRSRGSAVYRPGTLQGMLWKNGIFYVASNKCYYNGTLIPGSNVTAGEKQLVGMGAYVVVFPDGIYYNTATGELLHIAETKELSNVRIEELSHDSVYAKMSASGIGTGFKQGDTVIISGIDDDSFKVDGNAEIAKTITDISGAYLVVTASIQKTYSGVIRIEQQQSGSTRLSATGIDSTFSLGDVVTVSGSKDGALNYRNAEITGIGGNYIELGVLVPPVSISQSAQLQFQYYFQGSDLTKISGIDVDRLNEGDVIRITGCTKSIYNHTFTVKQAGLNYILIETTLDTSFTQNAGITIQRIGHVIEMGMVKRTAFTAPTVTIQRRKKDMDYVCEHDNRLWGCSSANHEIYASKLGDPSNWDTYEGISTDSYTATVGSDGDFTGIASHMGYVVFFKEDAIHLMYGSKPSNFQLNQKNLPGVRAGCSKSIQIINDTMYYVGRNGVYAFDGAVPVKISNNLVGDIAQAAAGQQDGRYYLSCLKDGIQTLYCYEPRYQIWDQEDDTKFKFITCGDGVLYYAGDDNVIYTIIGDRTDEIYWSMESGDLSESNLNQKYISKAQFNMRLEPGAEANIFFRYDDDPLWHRKGTIRAVKPTTYTLPIIAQRCNKFRWKIEGKGEMKLLAMSIMSEGGSELHGAVQSWHRR